MLSFCHLTLEKFWHTLYSAPGPGPRPSEKSDPGPSERADPMLKFDKLLINLRVLILNRKLDLFKFKVTLVTNLFFSSLT